VSADERRIEEDELWRLATAMSAATTAEEIARAVAEQASAVAGASQSNLAIRATESGRARRLHETALPAGVHLRWVEFEPRDTPLGDAMTRAEPVLIASPDDLAAQYPRLAGSPALRGAAAIAAFPLRTGLSGTFGTVSFAWGEPQAFSPVQTRRLELIATLAAQALERVLLTELQHVEMAEREQAASRLLHSTFLPAQLPRLENLEIAVAFLPAADAPVGGDWYDVFPVDGGMCLIVGDVAGHGLRAAAVMAMLRNAARAYAIDEPSPARVLTRLNRLLCRLEPGETATAVVGVWDDGSRTFTSANAGHPWVLYYRPPRADFLVPRSPGVLLGADPDWPYREAARQLPPGITAIAYTDALVEHRGRPMEEGMDRLRAYVETARDLSPAGLCDELVRWRLEEGPCDDDICILAVRLN
jgi:serine phosphatase RsbU (regulator of sigma subunit)